MSKKIVFLAVIVNFLIGYSPIHSIVNFIDEGQFGAWANHMIHGKLMYKDIYITYGPIWVYPYYLIFKYIDRSIFVIKLLYEFWILVGITGVFVLINNLKINKYLGYLILLVLILTPSLNAKNAILVLALGLFAKYSNYKSKYIYAIFGLLSTISLLISVDYGIILLVVFVFNFSFQLIYNYDFKNILRDIAYYIIGLTLSLAAFSYWAIRGGWYSSYIKVTLDVVTSFSSINTPNGRAFPGIGMYYFNSLRSANSLIQSYDLILHLVFILFLILGIFYFILFATNSLNRNSYFAMLVYVAGFLSCLSLLTREGLGHLYYSIPLLLIAASHLVSLFLSRSEKYLKWSLVLFFILLITRFVYLNNPDIISSYSNGLNKLSSLNINFDTNYELSREQLNLIRSVRELSGSSDLVFFYNDEPMYYLLTDRVNPTRFDLPFIANTIDKRYEILSSLRISKPVLVVVDKNAWAVDGVDNKHRLPEVYRYITKNYKLVKSESNIDYYLINNENK